MNSRAEIYGITLIRYLGAGHETCPHCGEQAAVFQSRKSGGFNVSCLGDKDEECRGVSLDEDSLSYINEQAAIAAWDKRA